MSKSCELRVFEALSQYNDIIKENIDTNDSTTIDELNEKIDIIMKALGLSDNDEKKSEKETEEVKIENRSEETPEVSIEPEEETEEAIEDKVEDEQCLKTDSSKYRVDFTNRGKNSEWHNGLARKDHLYFESRESLVNFFNKHNIPLSYTVAENMNKFIKVTSRDYSIIKINNIVRK